MVEVFILPAPGLGHFLPSGLGSCLGYPLSGFSFPDGFGRSLLAGFYRRLCCSLPCFPHGYSLPRCFCDGLNNSLPHSLCLYPGCSPLCSFCCCFDNSFTLSCFFCHSLELLCCYLFGFGIGAGTIRWSCSFFFLHFFVRSEKIGHPRVECCVICRDVS